MTDHARGVRVESLRASLKTYIYARPVLLLAWKTLRRIQSIVIFPFRAANTWLFQFRTGLPSDRWQLLENLTIRGPHKSDATVSILKPVCTSWLRCRPSGLQSPLRARMRNSK